MLLNSSSKIDGYLAQPDFLGATFLCFVQYSIGNDGNRVSKSLTSCSSSIPIEKKVAHEYHHILNNKKKNFKFIKK